MVVCKAKRPTGVDSVFRGDFSQPDLAGQLNEVLIGWTLSANSAISLCYISSLI